MTPKRNIVRRRVSVVDTRRTPAKNPPPPARPLKRKSNFSAPKDGNQSLNILKESLSIDPVIDEYVFCCIASGPSLDQQQIDLIARAKETNQFLKVIGINDNWQWKSEGQYICDIVYAADSEWWTKYISQIKQSGIDCPLVIPIRQDVASKHGLIAVKCANGSGISFSDSLTCSNHSGAQAINLAAKLNAKKIVLIGYDMEVKDKNNIHWFGNHPQGLRNTPGKYTSWIQHYTKIQKDLNANDIQIVNCSKSSAIKSIELKPLTEQILSIH